MAGLEPANAIFAERQKSNFSAVPLWVLHECYKHGNLAETRNISEQ